MNPKKDLVSPEERLYTNYAAEVVGHAKMAYEAKLGQRGNGAPKKLSAADLQQIFEEAGMAPVEPNSVGDKVRRGTYSLPFALHALAALGITELRIPPLPTDECLLRLTWPAWGTDALDLPQRFLGVVMPGKVDIVAAPGARVLGQVTFTNTQVLGLKKLLQPAKPGGLFVLRLKHKPVEGRYVEPEGLPQRWIPPDMR